MVELSQNDMKASSKRAAIEARGMLEIRGALGRGDSFKYFQLCEKYGVEPSNIPLYEHGAAEALQRDKASALERQTAVLRPGRPVVRDGEKLIKFNYSEFDKQLAMYHSINLDVFAQVDLKRAILKASGYDYLTCGKNEDGKQGTRIEDAKPERVGSTFKRQYEQLQKRKLHR